MSIPATPATTDPFTTAWNNLKAWAETEITAVEGGASAFLTKTVPVLEADLVSALETFGEDLMSDAVALLSGGLPTGQTISTVADNLIQTVETQGKTIANSLAVTAASQVVSAAQTTLGAMSAKPPA